MAIPINTVAKLGSSTLRTISALNSSVRRRRGGRRNIHPQPHPSHGAVIPTVLVGLRRDIISRTPSQRWFPIFITSIASKRQPRGGGNGKCAAPVPDARGQEQQWLSGPVAGAAAAVTMRMARQVEGLGKDIRTRAGTCTESPTAHTPHNTSAHVRLHCYCITIINRRLSSVRTRPATSTLAAHAIILVIS